MKLGLNHLFLLPRPNGFNKKQKNGQQSKKNSIQMSKHLGVYYNYMSMATFNVEMCVSMKENTANLNSKKDVVQK